MDQELIQIHSPLTGQVIGTICCMTKEQIDEQIRLAQSGLMKWKDSALWERSERLNKAADLMIENKEELANLIMLEVGKDYPSARSEVERSAEFIRFTSDIAKSLEGSFIPGDSFYQGSRYKFALTSREALGVILAISSFNYPVNLVVSKIAPALVMGNSVVLKPATQGSLCAQMLVDLFHKALIPNEALLLITGRSETIGDYLVSHAGFQLINFTGSLEAGKHIANVAGMVPLLMELGGKDAAIVLKDADLELAASQIVSGAFTFSGQRCTAIKRVLVLEEIADRLCQLLYQKVRKLKVSNPIDTKEAIDVVPLIDTHSADYVKSLIEDALKKGAVLLTGGEQKANLIQPTLLDYVTKEMKVAWEEPFGPVLPILRVASLEDAIAITNQSKYGLQNSIFTRDIDMAFKIARSLECGTVQINRKTERGPDHFPFAGYKSSGIGMQGIRYSLESMSRLKSTVVNLQI